MENYSLYLVLLPVGFTLPFMLPQMRCALTAPFHPYQNGGIFSVALSLKSPSPGVTRHRYSWRPDFPLYKKYKATARLSSSYRIKFFTKKSSVFRNINNSYIYFCVNNSIYSIRKKPSLKSLHY